MYSFCCRDHAVRETHSPRQIRRNPIVAVTAQETSNSSDGITCARCWRTGIQKSQSRNLFALRQNQQRRESSQESAKPSKSESREDEGLWICKKLRRRFQGMVHACADDSGQSRNANDEQRVSANTTALKISLQDVSRYQQPRR